MKKRGRPALLRLGLPIGSRRTGSSCTDTRLGLLEPNTRLGHLDRITRIGLIRGVGLRDLGHLEPIETGSS